MDDAQTHRLAFSLDGGGVTADEPLVFGEGRRLRVHLTDDRDADLTVAVEGGVLVVRGMGQPVRSRRTAMNVVEVSTGSFEAVARDEP